MRILSRLPGPAVLVSALLLAGTGLLTTARPASAQRMEETRLLRQAAALESRGELEAAEATLRSLLERSPTSAGGLFALERVLRARGAVRELLPVADSFLAHAPTASGVRHLKLRVMADVDSTATLDDEARAWFALDPDDEEAYREVSRIWARTFGSEAALEVLEQGRTATGDPGTLALEAGDLLADLGRTEQAVGEWAAALARDPAREGAVAERLGELAESRRWGRVVVERLVAGDDAPPERLRSAANLAVTVGLEDEAVAAARTLAGRIRDRARGAFLADLARRADERGMPDLAAWAWGELGAEAASTGERRQFDQRLVEASLAAGDTITALEAQRRVVGSFSEGSVDRRRALARALRLEAPGAGPERLRALLADFRRAFPDAPELDDLGATVAEGLMERGDVAGAATVLEGIDGPRSNMMRGWILMSRGDVALGRQALLMAVPGLPPTEATGIIQFAGLLGRLSPQGVALLAEARVRAHAGSPGEAAALVEEGLDDVPPEERAPLLAEAARMVEDRDPARAAALRRRILDDHPDASETAEAALELARALAREPEGRDEAVAILERLITGRPDAAVVPTARRELERLRGSGS